MLTDSPQMFTRKPTRPLRVCAPIALLLRLIRKSKLIAVMRVDFFMDIASFDARYTKLTHQYGS